MFAIIFSIMIIIAGIVIGNVLGKLRAERNDDTKARFVFWPLIVAILLAITVTVLSSFATVPTGFTGILTSFGRVENRTINAGLNFIRPWQDVVTMDNRTQKKEYDDEAFTKDTQNTSFHMAITWSITPDAARELYKTVGVDYFDRIMIQRLQEDSKIVIGKKIADGLIEERETLSKEVKEMFKAEMQVYGIVVEDLAISNIEFEPEFTAAVEAKQVALQNKLRAETEQAQKTMESKQEAERAKIKAQAEADQAIIAANADLEVVKVQAEAALYAGEREAEMNQRISKSLTDGLVSYYWIKQWDGRLPETVLSEDGNYMLALNQGENK